MKSTIQKIRIVEMNNLFLDDAFMRPLRKT